jgi:hypothetical protein
MKYAEFVDHPSNYNLFKKDSGPWRRRSMSGGTSAWKPKLSYSGSSEELHQV